MCGTIVLYKGGWNSRKACVFFRIKSFYNTCILMHIFPERHSRGRGWWTRGVCSGRTDPEAQLTWVAVYAFWILWGCHKRRGQPCVLSAVQSNLGGTVLVSISTEIQTIRRIFKACNCNENIIFSLALRALNSIDSSMTRDKCWFYTIDACNRLNNPL